MKTLTMAVIGTAVALSLGFMQDAQAASKQQKCQEYARNAARATPTTTGAARGAARGAVAGAVLGGNAGRGAAAGAVVGGTRKAVQKTRSYDYYYNSCMRS